MQWCQFCDKELTLGAVNIQEYICCGNPECHQKARDAFVRLSTELAQEKKATVPAQIMVFSTKSPAITESWDLVAVDNHPSFIKNPDILAKMLEEEIQAQDEETGIWYAVYLTKDVQDAIDTVRRDKDGVH